MVELNENNADSLKPELENRLEDIFGNEETPFADSPDPALEEYYPLSELKNLILSIDWEITDEVLDKLLVQIQDLSMTYEHDKIVLTLLQILNSLGLYIKKNRAKAHPKTFKTLNSVFSSLDKVVLSRDMDEATRKKILSTEMNRYRQLKIQIVQNKKAEQKSRLKKQRPADASSAPYSLNSNAGKDVFLNTEGRRDPSAEALAQAVEEIKQYIHAEIQKLREELKSLIEK